MYNITLLENIITDDTPDDVVNFWNNETALMEVTHQISDYPLFQQHLENVIRNTTGIITPETQYIMKYILTAMRFTPVTVHYNLAENLNLYGVFAEIRRPNPPTCSEYNISFLTEPFRVDSRAKNYFRRSWELHKRFHIYDFMCGNLRRSLAIPSATQHNCALPSIPPDTIQAYDTAAHRCFSDSANFLTNARLKL